MGASVLFVRLADVGPFASAFWRVALALPFLWAWFRFAAQKERQNDFATRHKTARTNGPSDQPSQKAIYRSLPAWLSGLFFAGDLIFWHLALLNTTVANATFMATMAPVIVLLLSGLALKERPGRNAFLGLAMCLIGGATLVSVSLSVDPARLIGDAYGMITACFFAGYFLTMRRARHNYGTAQIMAFSTLMTALFLAVAAVLSGEQLWPQSWRGFAMLLGLAFFAQVLGQGLLALALGVLPAAFSSLVIFLEAVAAAAIGWLLLSEPLSVTQILGGAITILGIGIARPKKPPSKPGTGAAENSHIAS